MAEACQDQSMRGCCLSMCPPAEMRLRQRERLVHAMECRPYNTPRVPPGAPHTGQQDSATAAAGGRGASNREPKGKARARKGKESTQLQGDPQYFVKEFARSSAGREIKASDVRPLPVLVRTLRYLLKCAVTRTDRPLVSVHEFVCNRLRAVMQDLAVQGLMEASCSAPILAAAARYYVMQQYRMCSSPLGDFDPFLNMKQLQETLACLVRAYRDQDQVSQNTTDQPKQHQFTFDLDDEEFFFIDTTPDSAAAPAPQSSDSGLGSDLWISSEDCDSNRAPNSGAEETTPPGGPVTSPATSAGGAWTKGRSASDEAEIASVLKRIASLGLDDIVGNRDTLQSQSHREKGSDRTETNWDNKSAGEDVKECRPNSDNDKYNELCSNVRQSSEVDPPLGSNETNNCLDSNNIPEQSECSSVSDETSFISTDTTKSCDYSEREELESMYLLLNLDNSEALQHALELPTTLKSGSILSKILPALLSYHSAGNFVPLLRLFNTLPAILSCSLYLNLPKLHKNALQVLSKSHHNQRYCVSELAVLLALPGDEDVRRLCRYYGLQLPSDSHVAFSKVDFKQGTPVLPLHTVSWLDARLAGQAMGDLLMPVYG